MAVDKLVDSTQLDADLTSVANAIRTKGGTSAQMAFPAGFVSAVQNISGNLQPVASVLVTSAISNTLEMANLLIDIYQWETAHAYFATIRGNVATGNYAGLFIALIKQTDGIMGYGFVRPINVATTISTGWSFEISAGAVINIYDQIDI